MLSFHMGTTNRLRVIRAEKRVTQEALEAKTKRKISQTRISLIENGYVEPTPTEQQLLATALGVLVSEAFPSEQVVSK